jgi:CcmD family protein
MNRSPKALLRALAPLLAVVAAVLASAPALADEFVPMDETARAATNPNPFIIGAYGFIWVAVLAYVAFVARGLGRAQTEVDELRKKVASLPGSRGA